MTETFMLTSNPLDGPRIPGTVGLPLPDVALRIADPATGALLPTGEIGVIEVKGPNVFSGYWRMPDKTREEFRPDGFFITGDLGTLDEDGYVRIVGRGKDLIISGGFNVYPKEVETVLDALPGIAESAVFGVWHRDFGEAVVAVAVPDGKTPVEATGVIDRCREQLANFKVPKAVMFVAALPRNTMGKVQKNELRERYKDLYAKD
jgi:malonyl-CoA/methylmalonyl-CoA synthetase